MYYFFNDPCINTLIQFCQYLTNKPAKIQIGGVPLCGQKNYDLEIYAWIWRMIKWLTILSALIFSNSIVLAMIEFLKIIFLAIAKLLGRVIKKGQEWYSISNSRKAFIMIQIKVRVFFKNCIDNVKRAAKKLKNSETLQKSMLISYDASLKYKTKAPVKKYFFSKFSREKQYIHSNTKDYMDNNLMMDKCNGMIFRFSDDDLLHKIFTNNYSFINIFFKNKNNIDLNSQNTHFLLNNMYLYNNKNYLYFLQSLKKNKHVRLFYPGTVRSKYVQNRFIYFYDKYFHNTADFLMQSDFWFRLNDKFNSGVTNWHGVTNSSRMKKNIFIPKKKNIIFTKKFKLDWKDKNFFKNRCKMPLKNLYYSTGLTSSLDNKVLNYKWRYKSSLKWLKRNKWKKKKNFLILITSKNRKGSLYPTYGMYLKKIMYGGKTYMTPLSYNKNIFDNQIFWKWENYLFFSVLLFAFIDFLILDSLVLNNFNSLDENLISSILNKFYYILPCAVVFIIFSFGFWHIYGSYFRKTIINSMWRESYFKKDWWKSENILGKNKNILIQTKFLYYINLNKKILHSLPTNNNYLTLKDFNDNNNKFLSIYYNQDWSLYNNLYYTYSLSPEIGFTDSYFKKYQAYSCTDQKAYNVFKNINKNIRKPWYDNFYSKGIETCKIFPLPRDKNLNNFFIKTLNNNIVNTKPLNFGAWINPNFIDRGFFNKDLINAYKEKIINHDLIINNKVNYELNTIVKKTDYINSYELNNENKNFFYKNIKNSKTSSLYDIFELKKKYAFSRFQNKISINNYKHLNCVLWDEKAIKKFPRWANQTWWFFDAFYDEIHLNWQDKLTFYEDMNYWGGDQLIYNAQLPKEKNKKLPKLFTDMDRDIHIEDKYIFPKKINMDSLKVEPFSENYFNPINFDKNIRVRKKYIKNRQYNNIFKYQSNFIPFNLHVTPNHSFYDKNYSDSKLKIHKIFKHNKSEYIQRLLKNRSKNIRYDAAVSKPLEKNFFRKPNYDQYILNEWYYTLKVKFIPREARLLKNQESVKRIKKAIEDAKRQNKNNNWY